VNNNIYISTTFLPDQEKLKSAIDILNKNDLYNIEIGSNHQYEENYNYVLKKKCNYLIHNYFPVPKKSFVINIASLDNKIRSRSINQIKKSILFCKKSKAKLYTFHPGFLSDPEGEGNGNKKSRNYDFKWKAKLLKKNYSVSWSYMIKSIKEVVEFAKKKNINIAIETEGSVNASDHLLMQKPIEYKKFMKIFSNKEIGINLNIGHLNLASKKFKFDKFKFIKLISNYIVAFECSHNYGRDDNHLPLKKYAWYWRVLKNKKYENLPKILEFRYVSVQKILNSVKLF
jgi:sugar phosphate isomerase/epimerase